MTVLRRSFLLVACVLALAVIVAPSVALANAGVHGNYDMNTDQCAGCHRAHTAPSSVTWVGSDNLEHSALLLGDYTQLYQFCYTCHGASALGAATNVEEGVLETRANGSSYGNPGDPLLSGPFGTPAVDSAGNGIFIDYQLNKVTSTHDYFGASWGAYGGGMVASRAADPANATYTGSTVPSVGVGSTQIKMDCGSCHDVHGSSNYRLLKDQVFGVTVGGYAPLTDNPIPYVRSNEVGYPVGGFRLHEDAIAAGYEPDYTTAKYSKAPDLDPLKGMSGWCVGCHTFYMGSPAGSLSASGTYDAGDVFGEVVRHRHPVNVELSTFKGPRAVVANPAIGGMPLAHTPGLETTPSNTDWIECLTCHNAHGTTAVMTGYANVFDPTDMEPDSGRGGVAPTDDSALLRVNNRGVCERCHNK